MNARLNILTAIGLTTAALLGCGGDDEGGGKEGRASTQERSSLPKPIAAAGAASVDLSAIRRTELSIRNPDWTVSAFGSLWVKRDDAGVVRVDPDTGKVIARIRSSLRGEHLCQGIGASEDAIWSCPREGVITRIDPAKNAIAATVRIDKLPVQGRIVSAADRVWALTDAGAKLTAIDPRDNKPADTVALDFRCAELAAAGDTLWAMCPDDDRVLRIDAATEAVTGELALAGATNAAVSDHVWVGFERGVAQIDPKTLDVLATYDVHPRYGGSLFATPDAVWVREEGGHFLTRIDPGSRRIAETIEAPELPSGGDVVELGGSVWATAYDDATLVELRP
jgi:streptogramin lyase